jgi:iron complex outermembrane recepter protein
MSRRVKHGAGEVLTFCFSISIATGLSYARADTMEGEGTDAAAVGDNGALQEVVVTAQKRSEAINRVGLSVSALTRSALKKQGVSSVEDLANTLPGLSYTLSNQSTPVYTLRGVGFYENSLAASPAVSVYVG